VNVAPATDSYFSLFTPHSSRSVIHPQPKGKSMRPVIRYQSQLLFRKSYKPNRVLRIRLSAKPNRVFRPLRAGRQLKSV
jgi:hypothetical protein